VTTFIRAQPVASRISPTAIGVSVLIHAAIGAAAALFIGLIEAPVPYVVVPVEVAFESAEAGGSPTRHPEAPANDEAAASAARSEPAAATHDASAPVDRTPPLAPARPGVIADPPEPTREQSKVEAAPLSRAPSDVVAPEPSRLVRDVPPPPAKPTPPDATDAKFEELRALPARTGGTAAGGGEATSRVASAIDQGKTGAAHGPSGAHAMSHGNAPPIYPDLARRRGWEGRVVLRVTVDVTGRPTDVAVGTTSGYPLLDEAAASAVRDWKFTPARLAGVPVMAAVDVPVTFRLTD
jgi:protein TonB